MESELDNYRNVSVLFVSPTVMNKAFLESSPTVIQVDTSFNLDSSKYKVAGFCYHNPTTNKSEMAGLAFLAEETATFLGPRFDSSEQFVLSHLPITLWTKTSWRSPSFLKYSQQLPYYFAISM